MAKSWINQVKPVRVGEPVAAAVVNRATTSLVRRTDYLRDRVDSITTGAALVDFDAAISFDVLEGIAVYWNATTQRYEPALAGMETDAATNLPVPSPASDCVGLVLVKKTNKTADILLFGMAEMSSLANAISGDITPGRYYLSGVRAGELVLQRPSLSVPVALVLGPKDNCSDAPRVLVLPQLREFQQEHVHYRQALVCRPAGTHVPPTEGEAHEITDANVELQGWLPADHASFNDTAPPGAVFGYNLAAHESLNRLWPPIPTSAACLLWDKGESYLGAAEIPLGADGLAVINRYGIWWMSNCYGDVPWPTTYDSGASSESSAGSSVSVECPRTEVMRLELAFIRLVHGNSTGVVTDLSPAAGSPIRVLNCDGDPGTTGSLQLALDLEALIAADNEEGSLVFKDFSPTGFSFRRGRVLEGVMAGSGNVQLSSTHQRTISGVVLHQGLVTVDVALNLDERELPVQIARLDDALERVFREVPVLAFPAGRASRVLYRIDVPVLGLPTTPQVKFRAQLLGGATGTLPAIGLEYKIIPRPDPTTTVPASWAAPAPTFTTAVAVTANDVIEVTSSAIDVTAGCTIIVELSREAEAYDGDVLNLRFKGILIGG